MTFWKVTAILFMLISVGAVLLALRCSDTLDCMHTYEDLGKMYCVSEMEQ